MKRVLSAFACLVMVITLLTAGLALPASAETQIVVWEGDINMEFTTKNTIAIINTDDTLTQAIRDDLALNGAATQYTLTSADSYYVGGDSGYVCWGFYDELTAATPDHYFDWWADKGSNINTSTWSNADELALMGLKVNLCIHSDGSGDTAYLGHIKLVATHQDGAVPVTTTALNPQLDPQTVISQGNLVWNGYFNEDFTTVNTFAMLKNDDMNDAIRNDIATNGAAKAYAVVADAQYVSGKSGYASYCFYQETPEYLEAWADKGSYVTSAVWTDAATLAQMGNKVQLVLCCDTDGDVIHINTLNIYALHDSSQTAPTTAPTVAPTTAPTTAPTVAPTTAPTTKRSFENVIETAYAVINRHRSQEGVAELTVSNALEREAQTQADDFYNTVKEFSPIPIEEDFGGMWNYCTEDTFYAIDKGGIEHAIEEILKCDGGRVLLLGKDTVCFGCGYNEENACYVICFSTDSSGDDTLYGDSNSDGAINMKDVLTLRKYLADLTNDIDLVASDVNADGVVNMKDVLMLRKYLADLIDSFSV